MGIKCHCIGMNLQGKRLCRWVTAPLMWRKTICWHGNGWLSSPRCPAITTWRCAHSLWSREKAQSCRANLISPMESRHIGAPKAHTGRTRRRLRSCHCPTWRPRQNMFSMRQPAIYILDNYSVHITEMGHDLLARGYILVCMGGVITGDVQINDTYLPSPESGLQAAWVTADCLTATWRSKQNTITITLWYDAHACQQPGLSGS